MQLQISPKLALYLNLALIVVTALGSGALYRPSFLPVATSQDIVGISASVALVMNTVLHLFSAPTAGPLANVTLTNAAKTVLVAALAGGLVAAIAPGRAGAATLNLQALGQKLAALSLADLQTADADAKATGDAVAAQCYEAVITLITAQQSVPVSTATGAAKLAQLVTTFQHARDLQRALRTGSPVFTACSALAQEVQMDFATFLGALAGGTLTLAKFAPLL